MTTPFIEENDQTRARREHLDAIRELVGNAYPNRFARTDAAGSAEGEDTITSIVREFKGHAPQAEAGARPTPEQLEEANAKLKEAGVVRVSGRVATPPRVMGKAAFVHLSDGKERLQIYVRRQDAVALSNDSGQPVEQAESGWALFQLLDHGDFVGVEGFVFVTRSGELSVHVEKIQFLSKALLPMPDKLHGINDPEIRQRQRYADLIASSLKVEKDDEQGADAGHELSAREVFERRSKLITQMRRHLDEHGYIEVETPMLSPIASGAAARPFRTHHNALDIDLYLRIAPELYLKRLVVGGFERVYELNRNFRNEGISTRHNPEFTMLEFYCAYMDADGMMDFCEEMLRRTIQVVTKEATVRFGGYEFDFGRKFERLTMKEAIVKFWPEDIAHPTEGRIDKSWVDNPTLLYKLWQFLMQLPKDAFTRDPNLRNPTVDDVSSYSQADMEDRWRQADAMTFSYTTQMSGFVDESSVAQTIEKIFATVAETNLVQPTFITDFPKPISPLSKASPDNPAIAERFELYIAGMECANGFSELNDPVEQYQRFEEQVRQRERGDEEAMQMDLDYVRALSYGMPPAAGIGLGIDRLTMLLTNRRSIRDVILFPHMRQEAKMRFLDLDSKTREFMLEEVELDVSIGKLYMSKRLSDIGRQDFEALLKEAIEKYDYTWLANSLRMNGRMKSEEERQKPKGGYTIARVPITAPDTLAEGEFNRFYIRGLSRRAMDEGFNVLIVYRAKEVKDPRRESEAKIGTTVDPIKLLEDLRAHTGVDTALGLPPGPNSGLSVRLPQSMM